MFQHTVDRARRLLSGEQAVVVAASHHRVDVESQLRGRPIGKLLWQPANRDTAAGVFLPLSYVWRRNPQATVVVYPSDHFIWPEPRFLDTVRRAIASVEAMPDRMLLLGVQPDRLETEYGWIMRGAALGGSPAHPVRAVSAFVEKPSAEIADAAFRLGALWNTFVLVAKAEALWQAGHACFPDMMPLFERLASAWGGPDERAAVEAAYREMPAYNFSAHLLQRSPTRVAVMELTGVLWSDWGKPERIAETIRRIGKTPAFPLSCLDRPFAPHAVPDTALRVPVQV
jgi:mannose-1-phosphate guanylyltransferase